MIPLARTMALHKEFTYLLTKMACLRLLQPSYLSSNPLPDGFDARGEDELVTPEMTSCLPVVFVVDAVYTGVQPP